MDYQQILLYAFYGLSGVTGLYYLAFLRFSFASKSKSEPQRNLPVSVIVVGRNEADNFRKNLPILCKQDYPEFEVLAVNDQSIDDSKDVIEELEKEYPNLRLVNVEENERFWLGKKYGLTLGIKAAQYENLLLTDADCKPSSDEWIAYMAQGFEKNKSLVLGFGAYMLSNRLVNLFIQFETIHTAVQYFSMAMLRLPYMGVGRNMAYRRELFFEAKGFVNHMHIPSGDDDLFVQEAAKGKHTSVVFDKRAHTLSEPKNGFKDWMRQKQRHYKTSKHYKGYFKFILGLYSSVQMLFYLSMAVGLILTPFWREILIVGGAKLVLQYLVFVFATVKLGSYRILWLLPLLEIFTWFFQLYAMILSRVNKKKRW